MKKVILVLVLYLFLSPPAVHAEDAFNFILHPLTQNVITTPGKTHPLGLSINYYGDQPISYYSFALDWKLTRPTFHFSESNRITFQKRSDRVTSSNDYVLPFTYTLPKDTDPGEYHTVVGVANRPLSFEESEDQLLMIGTVVSAQSYSGVALISASNADNTAQNQLSGEIRLQSYESSYNPYQQQQLFHLILENPGNISSIPLGEIVIRDFAGEVVYRIPINPHKLAILPHDTQTFEFTYKPSDFRFGMYFADITLGYSTTMMSVSEQKISTLRFLFLSTKAIAVLGITLTLLLLLLQLNGKAIHFQPRLIYISYTIVFFTLGALGYLILFLPAKSTKILGIQNQPANISLVAEVTNILGMRIVRTGDKKYVVITAKTDQGWNLWSLSSRFPSVIARNDGSSQGEQIIELTGKQTKTPLLLLPRTSFKDFYQQ